MKHCVEELRAFRYKLRMMGVPLEGPTYVFGDNMSVINNTSKPESTLKKKSNAIAIMLSVRRLRWESVSLDIFALISILLIC